MPSPPSVGGLGLLSHIYTPGSDEHGPQFNRGSGGGARGCGFEERVGAYARAEVFFPRPLGVNVCVCVKRPLKWQFTFFEIPAQNGHARRPLPILQEPHNRDT